MSLRELAVKLGMSAPGVGLSVERGEAWRFFSNHCLVDFLKQGSIPNLYDDVHGKTSDYETPNKNCVSHAASSL
jgi:hypothetical protein